MTPVWWGRPIAEMRWQAEFAAPARRPDLPARRRAARRRPPGRARARLRGRRLDALAPGVLAAPHRLPAGHLQRCSSTPAAPSARSRAWSSGSRRWPSRGAAGGRRRPLARRPPRARGRRPPARARLARRRHGLRPVAPSSTPPHPRWRPSRSPARSSAERAARLHDRGLRVHVHRRLPRAVPGGRAADEHLLQGRRDGPLVVVRRAAMPTTSRSPARTSGWPGTARPTRRSPRRCTSPSSRPDQLNAAM